MLAFIRTGFDELQGNGRERKILLKSWSVVSMWRLVNIVLIVVLLNAQPLREAGRFGFKTLR